jgi:hypothetical protein
MTIVRAVSILHAITAGKFMGRICNVRVWGYKRKNLAQIVFADYDLNDFATVHVDSLYQLGTPGWEDNLLYAQSGIKNDHFAHPRAMRIGDVLATNEIVVALPRRGYNSSVLIYLDKSGWVELAARLPIALKGNQNFKLPSNLVKDDKLITGCLIVKDTVLLDENWVNIFLNKESCDIEVPTCVPLALA